MGGVNVKNTMIERVLNILAPHPCSGCAKMEAILCPDCKYDIIHEPFMGCILCGKPQNGGVCAIHNSPIQQAFVVGDRTGALEETINRLKFQNTKAAALPLAELFHETLPLLPATTQIVPIPTVRSHIRQRGYDHIELLVRHLASMRNMPINRALIRINSDTQHRVGKSERQEQSSRAFALSPQFIPTDAPVLLVDDVVTTGSTLLSAARLLKEAGATVWVATLAYQPLD